MSIVGNTVGVFHAVAEAGRPPSAEVTHQVELISRKAGERIGLLRAFSKSEVQAHTDPLTGLMNRRSLEVAVRALVDDERPYVVAYGDLDLFKKLNDVYGHDAGDRALRLFARVVRDSLRPTDIAARYGGEEFVVVIPECSVAEAVIVINRLRERLAAAQHGGTVPPFTVSFGVAVGALGIPFEDTVERADAALLEAKSQGRDPGRRVGRRRRRARRRCSSHRSPSPASSPDLAVYISDPGCREQLAGLEPRLQAREDHRPTAVDLVVRAFAHLVVGDGQAAGVADRLDVPRDPRRALGLHVVAPEERRVLHEAARRVDLEVEPSPSSTSPSPALIT